MRYGVLTMLLQCKREVLRFCVALHDGHASTALWQDDNKWKYEINIAQSQGRCGLEVLGTLVGVC